MRRAGLQAVAATISLLILVGLGSAQETASAPALMDAQSITTSTDTSKQSLAMTADGRVHVDVVVRDGADKPVPGLQAKDFKLLDDGKERSVASFAAFDGIKAKPDPPVQMILVVDCVNNGFVELGYIRQGLTRFLRQNQGRLSQPTTIVRLGVSGVEILSKPSTDGNALAAVVDKIGAATKPGGLEYFSLSLRALSNLVNQKANEPGRKMLIWLGPGWPTPLPIGQVFTKVDARDQRADYQLFVQLAKAMQEGRIAFYGGNAGADFYMREFLKPVRKVSETDPRDLSLDVLALKSGGHGELSGINRDSAVTDILNNFVAEASTFYSLSFDPPKTRRADEFHELKVELDRPGLKVRAMSGYYDEPEYFQPEPKKEKTVIMKQPTVEARVALQPVTVAQLTEIVENTKQNHDAETAKEIARLELTERLSSPKLAALSAELPGAKAKAALMAVGDASVFLKPPPDEIPQKAPPALAEQRQMLALVVDYLKKVIPKLPDFYANRLTTSFEAASTPEEESGAHIPSFLQPAGEFKARVYYRSGNEVVHAEGAEEFGLTTEGTFGPILSTVIVDAAHSTTEWSRWEQGPKGVMAVFHFQVPQAESHYQVSFTTFATGDLGAIPTAYHGEFGIDPQSGTILRLVLEADPDSGSSRQRADIMVEYGAVTIGEKGYTCPVRSVSIAAGMSPMKLSSTLYVTRLDDVVFSDYHVFRSDFRILPDVPESSQPELKKGDSVTVQQSVVTQPGALKAVTVAQLTEIVAKKKRMRDWEAAKEIEHLQLTERLSSPKLAEEHGLVTRGTFGPILSMVILDAVHSKTTQWNRWEEGPSGPTAVFRFQVPQIESHYEAYGSGEPGMNDPTAYQCGGNFGRQYPTERAIYLCRICFLRSSQTPTESVSQTRVASAKTTNVLVRGNQIQKTRANPARPMDPIAAPRASMAATMRPRFVPSKPARALCSFSCASTRLAPAGKMAGKARKRPPMAGPNLCAIRPAATQTAPPNAKRRIHSWGLIPLMAERRASTIMAVI